MKNHQPLEVKQVPVPPNGHPEPQYSQLMKHEFTCGLIAPKGAGKTTVICNLLAFYKNYFHTILVFSPTIDSDEKWDWVKAQKLVIENTPLKKWIKEFSLKNKKNSIVQPAPLGMELQGLVNQNDKFTGHIPEENFFSDYDDDTFKSIMEEQMTLIKLLKKHGETKYLANRILIIFDDLVGSSLFAGSRGSYFKGRGLFVYIFKNRYCILNRSLTLLGVNTRHRHYSASFLMVSQGYKEVPKTIRTNWTALIVFEIGNEKEVEVIYEEFAMALNLKEWLESYREATSGDHSFLYINFQQPRRMRMWKNFQEVLYHSDI